MSHDKLNPRDSIAALMNAGGAATDQVEIGGHYDMVCTDEHGAVLWKESFDNTVTNVGKGQLMSVGLGTASQGTQVMSLISSIGFTAAPSATDTMASHSNWFEVDASTHTPSYGATRPTITFANVTTTSIVSSVASFVFTNSGTVNGAFIANGTGATTGVGNTGGVLFSGGTITAQPVITGNTITVSYTLSM